MKTFRVSFNVMGVCNQYIELNDDCNLTENELADLLEKGDVLTSVQEGGDVVLMADGKFTVIGKVVSADIDGEYEMFDVEEVSMLY